MKKILLFTSLFFISMNVLTQDKSLDSLKNILKESISEKYKLSVLYKICKSIDPNFKNEDEYYIKELIRLSQDLENYEKLGDAYMYYSTFFLFRGNMEDSMKMILEAKKVAVNTENNDAIIDYITQAGAISADMKKFEFGESQFLEGLKRIHKVKTRSKIATFYYSFAYFYMQQENDFEAMKYYLKSLDYIDADTDSEISVNPYNGLCWLYIDRKQYNKAKSYAFMALKDLKKEAIFHRSIFNRILGRVYTDLHIMDSAVYFQKKALVQFKKVNHKVGLGDGYNYLSFSLNKMKSHNDALKYADSSLSVASEINNKQLINASRISKVKSLIHLKRLSESERILSDLLKDTINKNHFPSHIKENFYHEMIRFNKSKGDYRKAFTYQKKLQTLKDSLNNARYDSQVSKAEIKYKSDKKEKENLQLKTEKAEQELLTQKASTRNSLLALGILGLGILSFIIWTKYKSEEKAKQIISKQKEEIEKKKNLVEILQKDLHHRMKNNLSFIDLFINLAKGRFTDKAYQTRLKDLQMRIKSMYEVHNQLIKTNDVTKLNTKKYIDKLISNVNKAYANENIRIDNRTSSEIILNAHISFTIGLIINEFLTNSYKYAFDSEQEGKIEIVLNRNDEVLNLSLKDNGKGLPKKFDINNLNSVGLETIQLLVEEYEGTFILNGENGVTMNITLLKTAF